MLARLRHDAIVGGHAQQVAVHSARARDHVAHEALVPWDVDQADPAPRRQLERREAQLDRDAARFLGRQAVGVAAGERQHQRRLPVVDATRGAEDHGRSPARLGDEGGQGRRCPRR